MAGGSLQIREYPGDLVGLSARNAVELANTESKL